MIKKVVNYEDFDGNQVSEELCFHLKQTELMEMAMELPDGVSEILGDDPSNVTEEAALKLVDKLGNKGIMDFIKKLVLKSYGKRVSGTRFEKSEELTKEFEQSLAYDALIMELITDNDAANDFMARIIPAGIADKVGNVNKPALPIK